MRGPGHRVLAGDALVAEAWKYPEQGMYQRNGLVGLAVTSGRVLWRKWEERRKPIAQTDASLAGTWDGDVVSFTHLPSHGANITRTSISGLAPRTGAQRWTMDQPPARAQGYGNWLLVAVSGGPDKPGMVRAWRTR